MSNFAVDTFLHYDQFQSVCNSIGSYLDQVAKLPRDKRIHQIKKLFKYEKTFRADTAQGVAGLLSVDTDIACPSNNVDVTAIEGNQLAHITQAIVFKLSIEVNRTIEHEYFVLKRLNELRKYCPSFVGTVGLLPAYVNREFFEDENEVTTKSNVLDVKRNPVLANYLLIEYVSDVTFRHIVKFAHRSTVTGVLLSVLCALAVAQNKVNFTHYDLHSGNMLMRKVEDDAYFAYILPDKVVVYPTYGWYPVIIDMGSSHVQGIQERPTRTSICHYHRGLQSTLFDPISDLHHFMISATSRLEKVESQTATFKRHFRLLATRMMHAFRHCNIWRYNGWKQLPCSLTYLLNEAIYRTKVKTGKFYIDLKTAVVETLALGVKLPWKPLTDQDISTLLSYYYPEQNGVDAAMACETLLRLSIEDINHFLDILDNDPLSKSDINVLYALRALVEYGALLPEQGTSFQLTSDVVNMFKQATQSMYPQYSYKLDLTRSFRGAAAVCKLLRHLLYRFNQENVDKIQHLNRNADFKTAVNLIKFLQQHTAVRYNYAPTSPIYVWDSVKERHIKSTFAEMGIPQDLTRQQLEKEIANRC